MYRVDGGANVVTAKSFRRTLMRKNIPVLRFAYDSEFRQVPWMEVLEPNLLPLGCLAHDGHPNRPAVASWVARRGIPQTRRRLRDVLIELGLSNPGELMFLNRGFSLTDRLWLSEDGDDASWDALNPYENDFDERLGTALAPHGDTSERKALAALGQTGSFAAASSPDAALNGELPKRWIVADDGTRWLLKAGRGTCYYQEPFGELAATRLMERVLETGEYVPYDLISSDDPQSALSACPQFTSINEEFVPAIDILGAHRKPDSDTSLFAHYRSILIDRGLEDVDRSLSQMIVCDYLMANVDRHWGNFGVLVDADTGAWLRTAPIFDNGTSLWSMEYNIQALPEPIGISRIPFLKRPDGQLDYIEDLSWLDPAALDGYAEETVSILRENRLVREIMPKRLDATARELERRVGVVARLAQELARHQSATRGR